jgi:hypothetical protein
LTEHGCAAESDDRPDVRAFFQFNDVVYPVHGARILVLGYPRLSVAL